MSDINIFCLQPVHVLKERLRLKSFLVKKASTLNRPLASLNIIFCSDDELLAYNRDFLQHDYYTDIITFDLSSSAKAPLEAELYISIDRVRDNAKTLGVAHGKELHRVIFHGLLHLLGYKDKQKSDQAIMRSMEDKFMEEYFSN
jgi:probable rRNA maturation factor